MEVTQPIVAVFQANGGLDVRTAVGLTDIDCVKLLAALALNFTHDRRMSAEDLLDACRVVLDVTRKSAGPVALIRGVE